MEKGLARGTIKHAFDVFRRVLDLAVRDEVIPSNPATSVPRLRAGDAEPFAPHPLKGTRSRPYSEQSAPGTTVYGLVVLFLAATGLRAAELAGLEISDLDLASTIHVRRTKRKVRDGWETGTPKSRKSRRTVPLDAWLVDDLRAYLADHPRRDDPSAPLFPARYGRNAPGAARCGRSPGDVQLGRARRARNLLRELLPSRPPRSAAEHARDRDARRRTASGSTTSATRTPSVACPPGRTTWRYRSGSATRAT